MYSAGRQIPVPRPVNLFDFISALKMLACIFVLLSLVLN